MSVSTEPWLRGAMPDIAPILQPLAYALILAREDIEAVVPAAPVDILWKRVNGAASAGFHVLHMAGALDRLFTYARGEMLTDAQKTAARAESQDHADMDGAALAALFAAQVERAMAQ